MMTKEKKNRVISIICIFITIISLTVIVFLTIQYVKLKTELDGYKDSSPSAASLRIESSNDENGILQLY